MLQAYCAQEVQNYKSCLAWRSRVLKVVVDLERLKFRQCGLGQFSFHLGQALLAETCDIQPILLLPRTATDLFAKSQSATLMASPWRKDTVTRWLRPLISMLPRVSSIDVWHVTHQDSKYWPLDARVAVVLTVHDLNFLREKSPRGIRRRLGRLQRKIDRASILTTGSQYSAEEIRNHLDVATKEIRVIPHGVCLEQHVEPCRPPALIGSAPYLFTIGDIAPKKNFLTLVELLPRLPEYRLIIAGSKSHEYANELERRAAELGIADRVVLPGRVSEAERLWLYQNCSAFLFPSLTEGFGLPLIEAMSFGRPVFSSNRTSLPEVGGPLAFYWNSFEPEYMERAFRDGMRTYEADLHYSTKLRDRAEQFQWPRAARQYLALYREVADRCAARKHAA
jgi:glycosyltransferase involved in cell wall biosynthesis